VCLLSTALSVPAPTPRLLDATGGRDGATFEATNRCEQGKLYHGPALRTRHLVPMFATGKAFPVRFYDPDLSATEQGILVGMYLQSNRHSRMP
jgi:hypothetical protein